MTDLIVSLAEAQAVDLIVMGTQEMRGIDRLMLGSVTKGILRRARCPVVAVRRPAHHVTKSVQDPEPVDLRKMLLCTDFSDHAHHASKYALSIAKEYGAELTVLYVLEDIPRSADLQSATEKVLKQLEESKYLEEMQLGPFDFGLLRIVAPRWVHSKQHAPRLLVETDGRN